MTTKRVRPGACAPGGVVGRRSRSRISERCRYGDTRTPDPRRIIISGGRNSSSSRPGATRSSRKRFRVRAARATPNYLDTSHKTVLDAVKGLGFRERVRLGGACLVGRSLGGRIFAGHRVCERQRAGRFAQAGGKVPRRAKRLRARSLECSCSAGGGRPADARCRPPAEKRESPTSAQPWIGVLLRSSPIADIWSCAARAKAPRGAVTVTTRDDR